MQPYVLVSSIQSSRSQSYAKIGTFDEYGKAFQPFCWLFIGK